MRNARWPVYLVLAVLLALAGALSMLLGETGWLTSSAVSSAGAKLGQLRGYRTLSCAIAGSALAMAGVLVQGLFRNPLASPSILGTVSGANLGAMLVLMLVHSLASSPLKAALWGDLGLSLGACAGAVLSLTVLMGLLRAGAQTLGMLLGGMILSSLFASLGSLLLSLSSEQFGLGRAMVAMTLGGVQGAGLGHVLLAAPLMVIAATMAFCLRAQLDLLLTGEREAESLGLSLGSLRLWVVIWVAVLTASAVCVGGNLMFVGLVVPHLLRPRLGVEHGPLLVGSAIGGAVFVISADLLLRVIPTMSPLPLGVVTSLVGAPLFLILVLRSAKAGTLS